MIKAEITGTNHANAGGTEVTAEAPVRKFAAQRLCGEWFQFTTSMLTIIVPDELPPPHKYQHIKQMIDEAYDLNEITAQQRHELSEEHDQLCK